MTMDSRSAWTFRDSEARRLYDINWATGNVVLTKQIHVPLASRSRGLQRQ